MNDNTEQTPAAPNSDTNNGGANNNNQRRTNRTYRGFDQADRKFEGMTPEIGGVLALPLEAYITKRTTFVKFTDLLCNYMAKTFRDAATPEVIQVIWTLEDTIDAFKK